MPAREDCPGSDHRPPVDGGACDCGMVIRIPVRTPVTGPVDVRTVLARCLDDESGGVGASPAPAVEQRADRLLAALADAGLVVTPEPRLSRPA